MEDPEDVFSEQHIPKKSKQKIGLLACITMGIVLIIGVVLIGLTSSNVKSINDIEKKIDNADSIGLGSEKLSELIYKEISYKECKNGLTVNPFDICLNECNREFCGGKYSSNKTCNGKHCNGFDVSFEECKRGCLCCKAIIVCLLENGNDNFYCESEIKECPHEPIKLPPRGAVIDDICYQATSTRGCERSNVGFNLPRRCI